MRVAERRRSVSGQPSLGCQSVCLSPVIPFPDSDPECADNCPGPSNPDLWISIIFSYENTYTQKYCTTQVTKNVQIKNYFGFLQFLTTDYIQKYCTRQVTKNVQIKNYFGFPQFLTTDYIFFCYFSQHIF